MSAARLEEVLPRGGPLLRLGGLLRRRRPGPPAGGGDGVPEAMSQHENATAADEHDIGKRGS